MAEAADTLLEYLEEANKLVLAKYPKAQFYEADNLTGDALGSQWQFVFNDPSTSPNSTVIIERLERGFGEPRHIPHPWLGDRVIKLPIHRGLGEARERCDNSKCGGYASAIVLRHPLYPGVDEPYYIVTVASERRRCWVGVNTGQVKCEQMTDA
ncbi:MAG TPA: hypothetical protein VG147_02905 [Solirubrobacteraceae bacterium]|jgi:hypothetical protein|nr:hypothetical protein [Solirubrobacteraceae bacterium]